MADSEEEVLARARKLEAWRELQHAPGYATRLLESYQRFSVEHTLQPGQLVRWKQGMKNRAHPDYGVAAVVIQVLDRPALDASQGAGSTYFNEPLDIVLGLLDSDGDLLVFHYDSRRFEPVQHPPGAKEQS